MISAPALLKCYVSHKSITEIKELRQQGVQSKSSDEEGYSYETAFSPGES